jgi:ABC-type lipoprotein export system ATPase subunit
VAGGTLEVASMSAQYGDFKVLHDISFTVAPGEIVSIVGSNGAGKTTTLRSIVGIIHPTGGTVTFDGTRIDGHRPSEIVERGLAMVPEGRNLFRDMTVEENLMMGAHVPRVRKRARQRVAQMYERFATLPGLAKRYAGTLSGGQQQIVAIARALMSEPSILLTLAGSLAQDHARNFRAGAANRRRRHLGRAGRAKRDARASTRVPRVRDQRRPQRDGRQRARHPRQRRRSASIPGRNVGTIFPRSISDL